MTTSHGFHSMSEERRIKMQMASRTDDQLAAMLAKPDLMPSLRSIVTAILIERAEGGK